jgi:hypothetical protein
MNSQRIQEIQVLAEACQEIDNTDLEAEKTAVIGELLAEVEQMKIGSRHFSRE